ncbi:MAG: nitrite reductase, copper-containing [Elusimicrobia bacterium]|nr:nitrite reductase, copper-containing [Elusimicrobiota bacterium]
MRRVWISVAVLGWLGTWGVPRVVAEETEVARLTFAPQVPPPIARKKPAVVKVHLETPEVDGILMEGLSEPTKYTFWTFNGHVPGPFIRVRQGDTLELSLANPKTSIMSHNIDLHAVTGPGGGAAVTLAKPGETVKARFKMLNSGLYVYHCAAPPVTDHIANGMYGLILVEPPDGLPKADREFYVMQGEFYTKEEFGKEGLVTYDREKALEEEPTYIVFNGKHGALMEEGALKAKVGEKVRIYFGNGGPNKISSFHVIGEIFDRVYREGGMAEPGDANIQTTLVPAGGAAMVEFKLEVPGAYTLVDHAIFRIEKGAVGQLQVTGKEAPEIYRTVK